MAPVVSASLLLLTRATSTSSNDLPCWMAQTPQAGESMTYPPVRKCFTSRAGGRRGTDGVHAPPRSAGVAQGALPRTQAR